MTPPDLDHLHAALPAEGRLVLCTHRHPDPDGLGAMAGLQFLLRAAFGVEADLVLEGRIRRAENLAMRRLLGIEALPKGGVDPVQHKAVFIVDSQPTFSHTSPPGGVPVVGVVDHHRGTEANGSEEGLGGIPFVWVDPDYGATSTMVFRLFEAAGVEPDQRVATALFCGVRYDTNDLARDAGEADERAYEALHRLADRKLVAAIDQPSLSREYFRQMAESIHACETYGPLLLILMGEVSSPEAVAEIADWFVRLEGKQWSLAGGACDGVYQVSLRTDMPGADAYPALRFILGEEGACGGHGRMAGGQIPLTDRSLEEVQALVRSRALEVFGLGGQTGRALVGDPSGRPAVAD
ncbi:MAG: hypothetical protein D6702_04680 [Planctomycetota bacterium]|nr:MAG: hypothetical protein D6702_04680 [Planctomycetota bacterium]